jgi:hypothetical protein
MVSGVLLALLALALALAVLFERIVGAQLSSVVATARPGISVSVKGGAP